jgi:glucose/arabinose dehydrogenase
MERRNIYIGILIIFIGVTAIGLESIRPDEQPSDVGNSTIVAENLDIPWAIEFLPEGDMLVTERPGTLLRIEQENGSFQESYQVEGVEHRGEGGLLGLALHPNYTQNNWIYLYMTTSPENSDLLQNRVVRYKFEDNRLSNSTTIIEGLPGAPYHDGGRIAFGPENKLYVTAGDATKPQWAQDTNRLAGKILRLNPDGSIPSDNPFGNEVYSYGHRNPQGITWINDQLWATEHGQTGRDELNKINSDDNYGWPVIEGNETVENMETPVINSGPDTTWAPAAATSINTSIYFAGLRGNGLYQAEIEDGAVTNLDKHLTSFGRLREVELGPNGYLYISTSNTDGRGIPAGNDDKIIKVNPENLT